MEIGLFQRGLAASAKSDGDVTTPRNHRLLDQTRRGEEVMYSDCGVRVGTERRAGGRGLVMYSRRAQQNEGGRSRALSRREPSGHFRKPVRSHSRHSRHSRQTVWQLEDIGHDRCRIWTLNSKYCQALPQMAWSARSAQPCEISPAAR